MKNENLYVKIKYWSLILQASFYLGVSCLMQYCGNNLSRTTVLCGALDITILTCFYAREMSLWRFHMFQSGKFQTFLGK